MKTEHKEFIVKELDRLCGKKFQNKYANKAQVSAATISQMRNRNWDLIRDEMWYKVKVNLSINWSWVTAKTSNLLLIEDILTKIQRNSMSSCISDKQGIGKTEAYKHYARNNKNVILIECKNYWSKKSFAKHQLIACGLESGGTTEEMIERFIKHLKSLVKAVVIYDQYDKLKEPQKDLFMDYYNELDGHTAFLLSGVLALEKQEKSGCNKNKMGYRERFSRYGSKWVKLNPLSYQDVKLICEVNGVTDKDVISTIYDECMGDGRRVRHSIKVYMEAQAEKKVA